MESMPKYGAMKINELLHTLIKLDGKASAMSHDTSMDLASITFFMDTILDPGVCWTLQG